MGKQRRKFSAQFKVDAVLDLISGRKTPLEICQERGITDKLLYRWKQELLERLPSVFEREQAGDDPNEARIAELERMVGRLTLENEILKNAESWRAARSRRNG